MKIAILILLHEYSSQQKKLIEHLSTDFDVFVHIDKKLRLDEKEISSINPSHVYAYKKYKVYWGSYNQILATLFLFRSASAEKFYDRFCFISGSDIPIKTNSDIINFFENCNKNFLSYSKLPTQSWSKENGGFDRIDFIHLPFSKTSKGIQKVFSLPFRVLNYLNETVLIPVLRISGLRRHRGVLLYSIQWGGANWMDLTDTCVAKVIMFVDKHPEFLKRFKWTRCADELFFQTIILNYVNDEILENRCLRYVDFTSGPEYPRILRVEDFEKIKTSDALFARKFNCNVDNAIINILYENVRNK